MYSTCSDKSLLRHCLLKAVDLLEHCHVADDEEDKQRLKLLCEAFSNGAVVAHKLKLPKSVMFHTGNVLRMDKNHRKVFLTVGADMAPLVVTLWFYRL